MCRKRKEGRKETRRKMKNETRIRDGKEGGGTN
jgi:hypothetical protein